MLVLLAVIPLNLLSSMVALIAAPTAASLLGGFGPATGKFIIAGTCAIAPVAGMFVFAILYLGILTDAAMLKAMAHAAVAQMPPAAGRHIPFPFGASLLTTVAAVAFGVLPL